MVPILAAHASTDVMPAPTHHVGRRFHEQLSARDGTHLYTKVHLPKGDGPFATIVTRVPYPMDTVLDAQCAILVQQGYACVYQHTRGRGRSEGSWVPFLAEESDGQDLVRWIEGEPWSNGKIGWLGDSYLAATGWTVAEGDPDGVDALVSRIFAPALYTNAYESGLLRHELITAWMALMPDERDDMLAGGRYHRALRHRPRSTLDLVAAGREIPWYRGWLQGEDPASPLWTTGDAARLAAAPATLAIPVMFVGGWADAFVEAQIDAWKSTPDHTGDLLVIGPWAHLGQVPSDVPLGGIAGPGGGGGLAVQYPRVLAWLGAHLRGEGDAPSGAATYVVGGDRWEIRPDWPPPVVERSFVASWGGVPPPGGGGREASQSGRCTGTLGGAPGSGALHYTYDPEHPLPSRGGAGMLAGAIPTMNGVALGFRRSNDHCARRQDVLRFTSAPLAGALHYAGKARVALEVASDAADTAFGFRLYERRASGAELLLGEGFTTLALRNGGPRQAYTPGERVRVTPDAAPIEAEVQVGSSLVLVLTSSSFPSYEAHPNVAGLSSEAVETRVAEQTVYAAELILPEIAP